MAEVGSKLEGTGFEKVHIVQTQVALVTVGGSGGARYPDSECAGDPVAFLCELDAFDMARLWCDRLGGFGIRVTLADDLRKPA